jgi:23S rRNA (cytosine1962-C5)-methyltransferase
MTPDHYREAFAQRASLDVPGQLDCYRLYHGFCERATTPHPLSIDRYNSAFLIKTYQPELPIEVAVAAIKEAFPKVQSIVHKQVYRRASLQEMAGEVVAGAAINEDLVVHENGRRIAISLLGQRNTGIFLDARALRDHVSQHASGRSVLNLFSYTGAFGIAALQGGSRQVVNVDSNRNVHKRAQFNYQLNALDVDERDFVKAHVEESLRFYKRKKKDFDLIIFDPPPASRRGRKQFRSKRDYFKLFRQVLTILAPGGLCYALCTDRDLMGDVNAFEREILAEAKKKAFATHAFEQLERARDFPHSEGESLFRGVLFSRKEN